MKKTLLFAMIFALSTSYAYANNDFEHVGGEVFYMTTDADVGAPNSLSDESFVFDDSDLKDVTVSTDPGEDTDPGVGKKVERVICSEDKKMDVKIVFTSPNDSQSKKSEIKAKCVKGFTVKSTNPLEVEAIAANPTKDALGVYAKIKIPKVAGWLDSISNTIKDKVGSFMPSSKSPTSEDKQEYLEYEFACKFGVEALTFVLKVDGKTIIPYCGNKKMIEDTSDNGNIWSNGSGYNTGSGQQPDWTKQTADQAAANGDTSQPYYNPSNYVQEPVYNPYATSNEWSTDPVDYTGNTDNEWSEFNDWDSTSDDYGYEYKQSSGSVDGLYDPLNPSGDGSGYTPPSGYSYGDISQVSYSDTDSEIERLLAEAKADRLAGGGGGGGSSSGLSFELLSDEELLSLNNYKKSKAFDFMSYDDYKNSEYYNATVTENKWLGWRQRFLNPSDFSYDAGTWINETTQEKKCSWWSCWWFKLWGDNN